MLNRFFKERRSAAAVEFVLVAPVVILLFFGVYDVSSALIAYEEVYAAGHSMAASLSNEAVQANGTNSLTYTQVQQGASLLWAEIPSLRSGLQDGVKSVTVSSIVFELLPSTTTTQGVTTVTGTCTPSATQRCNYVPVVVWSIAYTGGDSGRSFQTPTNTIATDNTTGQISWSAVGLPLRSCIGTATTPTTLPTGSAILGTLNQSSAQGGSVGDLTNLRTLALSTPAPANPAPPSPMLVVDVQFNYQPVIGLFIGKTLPLWVSGYWPVRSVEVSTSTTYPLNEEFVSIDPDVPTADLATATQLQGSTAGNELYGLYDADGNAVSTQNYCVNTTLYGTYGGSPETQ